MLCTILDMGCLLNTPPVAQNEYAMVIGRVRDRAAQVQVGTKTMEETEEK